MSSTQICPPSSDCRSLQYKLTCLRDGHKESAHFRMSYCNWATSSNLFLENGDNASVGAKDISKTNGDKLCATVLKALLRSNSADSALSLPLRWSGERLCRRRS